MSFDWRPTFETYEYIDMNGIRTLDLYSTVAVLYQLSYQAHWELESQRSKLIKSTPVYIWFSISKTLLHYLQNILHVDQ